MFLPYSKHDICFCGVVKREQRPRGGKKGKGGKKKEMASGTWGGGKNREENYMFENSNGERSHCWVMNKSLCSVYISNQLTFHRICSTAITAPSRSVPCSCECVHPSPSSCITLQD